MKQASNLGSGRPAKFMRPAPALFLLASLSAALLLTACGPQTPTAPPPAAHKHEHHPPHGGTPVVLGDEQYHVEFVLDKMTGIMNAYVLDGEMENFVRIAMESFDVTAQLPDGAKKLAFHAVASNATGETVGATSKFEAQADWLKTATNFDAVLKSLNVRGTVFENVAFNFPKGNDKD
ncbi:MAG TPA: hypothetical protein VFC07_14475 [Verrucomicrobiae bacterium]|nr:hypothetical protein [Verrucomicrobiae bacterium]